MVYTTASAMLHLALVHAAASIASLPPFHVIAGHPRFGLGGASSTFRGLLRSAVSTESDNFANQVFASQEAMTDLSGRFTFTSCLFVGCRASSNGGAIQVGDRLTNTVTLRVVATGFANCATQKQGGAIYARCQWFEVARSCIDACRGRAYSAFLEQSFSCDLSDSWVTSIDDQDAGPIASINCDPSTVWASNFSTISP
jgi:hypothetical protein